MNHIFDVDRRLIDEMASIASRAAAAILAIGSHLQQREKDDRSPVTAADVAAEQAVLDGLQRLLPGVPVVSEESFQRAPQIALTSRFVLVDPLDGTRELIAGESEYAVNIALVDRGNPVAGVIAAPALGTIWTGIAGLGAERLTLEPGAAATSARQRTAIRTRTRPSNGGIALVSRFHRDAETDACLDRFAPAERRVVGASLKFCRIAEGAADLYVRAHSISEWDVAAGHAVVVAAGGMMTGLAGEPLPYGRAGFRVPPFMASGDRASQPA